MKSRKLKPIFTVVLALMMSLACLAVYGQSTTPDGTARFTSGGTLLLRVNPQVSISYDKNGNVTKVEGRNDDGNAILRNFSGYEGKACRQVVSELVTAIGKAGYLAEDAEGKRRQITIAIENGSHLPYDAFLDEVFSDARQSVRHNAWNSAIAIEGESNYGMTNYVDTDYGPNNDGATDYQDTDYGPNNDGVTDYGNGRSDYGSGNSNYGNSNYVNSNYGGGNSDYDG